MNGNSTNNEQEPNLEDLETTKRLDEQGPKAVNSAEKKKGNKNATKHSLYSEFVILTDESESDFNALLEDLRTEWQPRGRSECEAVFDLGYLTLLKQRWRKYAQLRFEGFKPSQDRIGKEVLSPKSDSEKQSEPLKYAQFLDVSELLARLDCSNRQNFAASNFDQSLEVQRTQIV